MKSVTGVDRPRELTIHRTDANPRGNDMTDALTTVTSFRRRSQDMDEAMRAGIAATACSVLILAIVWLAMHALPVSIG